MCVFPFRRQDAEFEHKLAIHRDSKGQMSTRRATFGMPRLNQNFERAVFFLYAKDPATGELKGPQGTGVFVGVHGSQIHWYSHTYAVTCAHVAPQGASVIRLNTRDGQSRTIELEPDDWITTSTGSDVAAVDITEHLDLTQDHVTHVTTAWFADLEFIRKAELGIGEDGFMLGLFANQPGLDRNRIAARFGNISLMADEKVPIKWEGRPPHPAHIFDMRSRGGFSGAPVFVYRTPGGDLREVSDGVRRRTTRPNSNIPYIVTGGFGGPFEDRFEHDLENNLFVKLLGIHAGQYPETVTVRKLDESGIPIPGDAFKEGDKLSMPSGMTLVVPAWEITNLLNLPMLAKERLEREKILFPEMSSNDEPEATENH